jgi:prepilin-type N-terminal cleavage/methylation domain-containing protein
MKIQPKQERGFTLVEVIATLVLLGLAAVFATMLLETSTRLFVEGRNATQDSEKIQVAMNRLVKELTFASLGSVVVPNNRTIRWTSQHADRVGESGLATWSGVAGDDLRLSTSVYSGAPLIDHVGSFTVAFDGTALTLSLRVPDANAAPHVVTIHPRYE